MVLRRLWWGRDRCSHLGSQVKCVCRYWELILKNGDDLGWEMRGVHRREESRVVHHDLLNLLGMGAESEEMLKQMIWNAFTNF